MAYENIPLNWEMLSLFGAVGVAGAGGAWKVARLITAGQLSEWQLKYGFAQQRAETAEIEFERIKRRLDFADDLHKDKERLIFALQDDLRNARARLENPQLRAQSMSWTKKQTARKIAKQRCYN